MCVLNFRLPRSITTDGADRGTLSPVNAIKRIPGMRALRARLLDILWAGPVGLREGILWAFAPKLMVSVNRVCVNPHNQALLLEQRFPRGDRWNMPGGFVKHGEHPEESLLREIREETGFDAALLTVLWVFRARRQIHLCYLCRVPHGEPVIQSSEIVGYEWIDLLSPDPRRLGERRRAAEVLALAEADGRVLLRSTPEVEQATNAGARILKERQDYHA